MHAIITGASSGIGEALAREWARHGAALTLVARRTERLQALAATLTAEHGVEAHVVTSDLSALDRCTAWLSDAVTALGPVDVLLNNAGMQLVEPFELGRDEDHERLVAVNLLAPMRLARALLPDMLARRSGTLVQIASLAALAPTPFMSSYNASKAGLGAFSEALRGELLRTGVGVLTVYPGPVDTAMANNAQATYAQAGAAGSRLPTGTTTELARRIWRAVARRQARLIYPGIYGVSRWFPGLSRWSLDRLTPDLRGSGQHD